MNKNTHNFFLYKAFENTIDRIENENTIDRIENNLNINN